MATAVLKHLQSCLLSVHVEGTGSRRKRKDTLLWRQKPYPATNQMGVFQQPAREYRKPYMRIISFDLDGTLVTDEFSQTVWHQGMPALYAEHYSCSFDRARALMIREYDAVGDDALEWYDIQHWLRHFNLNADWKSLLAKFTHYIRIYPEVHEVLDHLSRRYELMITSNAAREFLNTELEAAGIAPYFKHVVSATSDFRQVKKSREFYHELCRMCGVGFDDLVHVGDHYRFDYLVPCELGIMSFYLDRSGNRAGPFMVANLKEFVSRLET